MTKTTIIEICLTSTDLLRAEIIPLDANRRRTGPATLLPCESAEERYRIAETAVDMCHDAKARHMTIRTLPRDDFASGNLAARVRELDHEIVVQLTRDEPPVREHIDATPSFEQSAKMCILLLEAGSEEGKRFAREELTRYGRELDRLKAASRSIEEGTPNRIKLVGFEGTKP